MCMYDNIQSVFLILFSQLVKLLLVFVQLHYFKRHSNRLLLTQWAAHSSIRKVLRTLVFGECAGSWCCVLRNSSVWEQQSHPSKMETLNAGHMMSLAALQRQDPYINKLLDVTGQVALYNFNSKANEWVRLLTNPKQFRVQPLLQHAKC